jgi:DNA-binding beta-propeller fold protein YncE
MSTMESPGAELVLGSGKFRYREDGEWGKLPAGWALKDVAAVAVDREDRVYAFNRGEHPVVVFDRNGEFLGSWGEGVFKRAHGAHIGADDMIYLTDDGDHTVRKCTLEGKVLLQLGIPGQPAPYMSLKPFNRCTHTALSPENDIYVSDGYGNARIHKYSADGKLLMSWGGPGIDPGEFSLPHNLCCDADGHVYVADRESHRVQVFDGKGKYQGQWTNLHRPNGMCMDRNKEPLFYIGEGGPAVPLYRNAPNFGPRVSIANKEGQIVARLGDRPSGVGPGQFMAPHGMAVDSHGDIYVGEVSFTVWPDRFPDKPIPSNVRTLRKLVRVT